MSGLARWRPFVWLCNFCAFLPFRMEITPESGQFDRFRFSWCHPVTCWFILAHILLIFSLFLKWSRAEKAEAFNQIPSVVLFALSVYSVFFHVLLLVLRIIVFRFRNLQRAILWIRKADEKLRHLQSCTSERIARHVVIGGVLSLFAVQLITTNLRNNALIRTYGLVVSCISTGISVLTALQIVSFFFLFNLIYSVLAHRIQLLNEYLSNDLESRNGSLHLTVTFVEETFELLCRAAKELNSAFSFSVLLLVTSKFITSAFSLFLFLFFSLNLNPPAFIDRLPTILFVYFILDATIIAIIFASADLPFNEVIKLREKVMAIPKRKIIRLEDQIQVISLMNKLSADRMQLSASGLFNVGVHLVPNLTASVITYIVVLYQQFWSVTTVKQL